MDKSLEQLDYKGIFRYFSEISKIPRGSGNEKEISDFLVSFAKEHDLEYTQDESNNVIMIKKASVGYEAEPAILLQGHMDMVCEKLNESSHDFLTDGIKLLIDGDFLHADNTTLGADNGIAVAYIMAILADETLPHPRLEAVITSDEEVGMQGAHALDCSNLQAKYMINLDSEEEGYLLSSCAGGLRTTCTLPLKRVKQYGKKIKINIGGLAGGHSGIDIIDNRTNANKLLGRLLFDLKKTNSFSILTMQGGFKDNVIPREANAVIFISAEGEIEEENNEVTQVLTKGYQEINKKIMSIMSTYQKELAASEPGLSCLVEDMGNEDCEPLHPISLEKVLFMLIHIPDGIQVMSSNIKGLVESSLNLGVMNLEGDKAEFTDAVRSSFSSYKKHISSQLEYLVGFLGGEYEIRADYPAWEFKKESLLREHLKRIYKDMYDKEMIVEAIHAGLECGIIYEKMPGIDIVSIGPDTFRVHTIDEKVSISSTIRVYQYLEQLIKEKIREV